MFIIKTKVVHSEYKMEIEEKAEVRLFQKQSPGGVL